MKSLPRLGVRRALTGLSGLQAFEVRPQVLECLFERSQAILRARQVPASAHFLERQRRLEDVLRPESGHRALQTMGVMLDAGCVVGRKGVADLIERPRVIIQEEPYYFAQQFEISAHTAQRERFIQVSRLLVNQGFLVSLRLHKTASWHYRFNQVHQFRYANGFADVCIHTRFQTTLPVGIAGLRGHRHDRKPLA